MEKTALITGATSGIGLVIAEHLAKSGYSTIVLARSQSKLDGLLQQLRTVNPNVKVHGVICDLAAFDSVKEACKMVRSIADRIDLMVLNAGLWNFEFKETVDKIEQTLQVNLLSQVLILRELESLIPRDMQSKVLLTSSALHTGEIYFDDIQFRHKFSGFKAYRQSKLGQLLLTRWLPKQPEFEGINFYAIHPGMVNTQLGRSAGWFSRFIFQLFGISKEKGARTHQYVIDRKPKDLQNGEYYAKCKQKYATKYSYDLAQAKKLWEVALGYINR